MAVDVRRVAHEVAEHDVLGAHLAELIAPRPRPHLSEIGVPAASTRGGKRRWVGARGRFCCIGRVPDAPDLFDLLDLVLTRHARVVGAHPCHVLLQLPLPRPLPHGLPAAHLLAKADGTRNELDLQPGEVLLGREPIPLAGGRLGVLAADNRARAPLWPAPPPHCHGEGPTDDGEGISVREPMAKGSVW